MNRFKFPRIEKPSMRVRVMRYFMTIFCFFFIVFGFGVITCSALMTSQRQGDCGFTGKYYIGVYLLLAAGCVTSFISLLACLHTRRSSSAKDFVSCCAVLLVVLVLQILAAISAHISYTLAVDGELASDMKSAWGEYNQGGKSCVDMLQTELQCCGVHNHSQWPAPSEIAGAGAPYPSSCQCAPATDQCIMTNDSFNNATVVSHIYEMPCFDKVLSDLYKTLLIPRIVGPVASLVEFVVFLAVIYFLHSVANHSLVGAYVVTSSEENCPGGGGPGCPRWAELQDSRPGGVGAEGLRQESSLPNQGDTALHL